MATFRTSRPGSAADPSRPHLVLVGLPGSGKSTVGEAVAARLGRTFLDFDVEIARREMMSVAELFAQRGEPHFRTLERRLTEELTELGNMVLAPGGGWMADPANVALLRPPATVVYLRISPRTALARMGALAATRPLLSRPRPLAELERLLAERRAAYESADLIIDVETVDIQKVTAALLDALGSP